MRYPCNLIRDILPLYHDKVASEESVEAVLEHLKECKECEEYYSKMCSSDVVEAYAYDEQMEQKKADSYQKVYKKIVKKVCKLIGIILLVTVLLLVAAWAVIAGYFKISANDSKEIYTDVNEYEEQRSGENALEHFEKRGMMEIWPEAITDGMEATDYFMMYYNPWDANYLGYLVVKYDETAYEAQRQRLEAYPSTEYLGVYGAAGFADYEVLAMNAGDDGFVYAITDGKEEIVYVEMIFPGYAMDIEYEKYIPKNYLPEGLDAAAGNPTQQEVIERHERKQ